MGLRRALWLVAVVATATPAASEDWSFALSAFVFDPPKDSPYISPIFYADRGGLHLEARYNYEDLETGSLFVGRSFDFGENVSFTAVPMLGIVAGSTNGVAPGAEIEIAWRRLALYAESEYVLDLEDSDASFLYTWSEATLAPVDWLRFGLVVQRTRTYDTGLDLQRGLLIELSHAKLSFAFHWFNPDRTEDQVFAYAAGYEF
ncbi:MAG TPA: hypothetical protein VEK15_06225 [Vicinamibacteria bacterium]|nr:hypothetical protein [Vicinamibacteria bacterium]